MSEKEKSPLMTDEEKNDKVEELLCKRIFKDILSKECEHAGINLEAVSYEKFLDFTDNIIKFFKGNIDKITDPLALRSAYSYFYREREESESRFDRELQRACEREKVISMRHGGNLPRAALTISIMALALALLGLILFFI